MSKPWGSNPLESKPWGVKAPCVLCQNLVRTLSEPCQNLVRTLAEPCQNIGRTLSEPCQNIGRTLSEHWQNLVRTLSKPCQNLVRTLPEPCQNLFRTLSEPCQNLVRTLSEHCQNLVKTLSEPSQNLVNYTIHHVTLMQKYCHLKNICFLVHNGMQITNGLLVRHEPKIRACHSYVPEILVAIKHIHASKLSFWRRHFFVICLQRTRR